MKLFRILDPFTLTPVVTVLLASFFPRAAVLCHSLKDSPPRPSRCCSLCTAPNSPAKPLSQGKPLATPPVGHVQHLYSFPNTRRAVCVVGSGQC